MKKVVLAIVFFSSVFVGKSQTIQTHMDFLKQADQLVELKDYIGALVQYDKAIALDNTDPNAYFNRAHCKFLLNDYAGASTDYTKVLSFDPKDVDALEFRGICKYYLKDYQGAINDFTTEISLKPSDHAYQSRADAYLELEKYDLAVADYAKAAQLNPENDDVLLNEGYCLTQINKFQDALLIYQNLIKRDALNHEALFGSGFCKIQLNDINGACVDIKKSASLGNQEAVENVDSLCK